MFLFRPELLEYLQEMREEKKMIRKKLHDFEDNFFRQNGRYVCVSLSLLFPIT